MVDFHALIQRPNIYRWRGWTWEVSAYGPWPLRKDGELRKRSGPVFWKVWCEFVELAKEEQKSCCVGESMRGYWEG